MSELRVVRVPSRPVRTVRVFAGPQGPAGMRWRGAWSSGATYVALDGVSDGGASYICTAAVGPTATAPGSDSAHWDLLAKAGVDGIDGTGTMNGPASATDGNMAVFDGTDGKKVRDGGAPFSGSYDDLDDVPATFPPITGTGAADAMPGDTVATDIGGAPAASALGVTITDKSSAYTLTAGDAGTVIRSTAATAITITVPNSTFSAGHIIEVMQYGAGQVTIAAGSGVTLRSTADAPLKTSDQYAAVSILMVSASEGVVTGGLA